jgi:hypothetical protein
MTRSMLIAAVPLVSAVAVSPALGQDKPSTAFDAPCVAIVMPSVEGVDDSTAVAMSVRSLFQSYLTGPSLRSIALNAKLLSQANEEATQMQCTKVLTVSLARKAGGNSKSKVAAAAQAAGTAAGYIPGGGIAEIAVAGAAAGAQAIGSLAQNTRAKDEMRMEYRVTTVDGAQILGPKSDRLKARSNGEDIVTPLVERAAISIAFVVTK